MELLFKRRLDSRNLNVSASTRVIGYVYLLDRLPDDEGLIVTHQY